MRPPQLLAGKPDSIPIFGDGVLSLIIDEVLPYTVEQGFHLH
jgi:hypothetical protein